MTRLVFLLTFLLALLSALLVHASRSAFSFYGLEHRAHDGRGPFRFCPVAFADAAAAAAFANDAAAAAAANAAAAATPLT